MRLVQFETRAGARRVGVPDGGHLRLIDGAERVRDLALEAARDGKPLAALIEGRLGDAREDEEVLEESGAAALMRA